MRKRFDEIDFARAIPLLFLPLVHCYEELTYWGYLVESAADKGTICLYLCAFGPSIFMLVLGMNIAFTSHNSAYDLARRGVKTLIIGLALHLTRFFLPGTVLYLLGEDWALLDGLISSFMSDILPFAGMAFLFFALMKKWKVSPVNTLLVALVLLSVHTLITPENMESTVGTELLGNFVHATEESAFPLLSWLTYPAIGYMVGLYMKQIESERELRRFYGKVLIVSLVGLAAVCVCMYSYDLNFVLIAASPANNYTTDLFNILLDLFIGGIFISLMSFAYFGIRKYASPHVLGFVTRLSKAIMIFYIIQWVCVGWLEYMLAPAFEETYSLSGEFMLLCSVAIMLISIAAALPIKAALDRRKSKKIAAGAA